MSSLREVYKAIALEVQEKLAQEYLGKIQFDIPENLAKDTLKIAPEYQPKAS
jgi:hypothetical protein